MDPESQASGGVAPPGAVLMERELRLEDDASAAASAAVRVGAAALAAAPGVPLGLVLTPFDADAAPGVRVRRSPAVCGGCGAAATPFGQGEPEQAAWRCAFCGSGKNAIHADERGAELMLDAIDFAMSGSAPGAAGPPAVVFVVDESLDADELDALKGSLVDTLRGLPGATRVGIMTFGRSVALFDLGVSGIAAADVLRGDRQADPAELRLALFGTATHLAPVAECLPIAEQVVGSLRPLPTAARRDARPRCLGPAVDVALALLAGGDASERDVDADFVRPLVGRAIVCTGGAATRGPGGVPPGGAAVYEHEFVEREAANFMEGLGRDALRAGVAVDVLAGGLTAVGAPSLLRLTRQSGGSLALHEGFSGGFRDALVAAAGRGEGGAALMDVRCSPGVAVTRVIGPARELQPTAREAFEATLASGAAGGEAEDRPDYLTPSAVQLTGSYADQGVTIMLELKEEEIADPFVYVQVSVAFMPANGDGSPVLRVVTRKVPTTGSVPAFLKGVDADTTTLLLAKRVVLAAQPGAGGGGDPEAAARAALLEQLGGAARALSGKGSGAREAALPRELAGVAERLYHLQRGPLLGAVAGHADERAALRALFLDAAPPLALAMMCPRLYGLRRGDGFEEELPAVSLAMASTDALLLDHGTDVFCWLGAELPEDAQEEARAAAGAKLAALGAGRFPPPTLRVFREYTSQARFMNTRLAPLHKEHPTEQELRFPQLRLLAPEVRAALQAKFLPIDEPSFTEWLRKAGVAAPKADTFGAFMQAADRASAAVGV